MGLFLPGAESVVFEPGIFFAWLPIEGVLQKKKNRRTFEAPVDRSLLRAEAPGYRSSRISQSMKNKRKINILSMYFQCFFNVSQRSSMSSMVRLMLRTIARWHQVSLKNSSFNSHSIAETKSTQKDSVGRLSAKFQYLQYDLMGKTERAHKITPSSVACRRLQ